MVTEDGPHLGPSWWPSPPACARFVLAALPPDVPYEVFDVEVTPLSTATLTRDTGT
jgi:hypothetical protein